MNSSELLGSDKMLDIYKDGKLMATVLNGDSAFYFLHQHQTSSVVMALADQGWSLEESKARQVTHQRGIASNTWHPIMQEDKAMEIAKAYAMLLTKGAVTGGRCDLEIGGTGKVSCLWVLQMDYDTKGWHARLIPLRAGIPWVQEAVPISLD